MGSAFWQVLFAAVSYLVTVALFVLVYRFMPKAKSLCETLSGRVSRGTVVGNREVHLRPESHYFHYDQVYGSVGAVVAVLTWSYVSSLILLFGAQLTAVFITSILPTWKAPPANAHLGF